MSWNELSLGPAMYPHGPRDVPTRAPRCTHTGRPLALLGLGFGGAWVGFGLGLVAHPVRSRCFARPGPIPSEGDPIRIRSYPKPIPSETQSNPEPIPSNADPIQGRSHPKPSPSDACLLRSRSHTMPIQSEADPSPTRSRVHPTLIGSVADLIRCPSNPKPIHVPPEAEPIRRLSAP